MLDTIFIERELPSNRQTQEHGEEDAKTEEVKVVVSGRALHGNKIV